MVDAEIHGLEEVQANMQRRADAIRNGIPELTRTAVLFGQSQIPPYPAPPPSSSYQRTGTLGRVVTSFGGGVPGALSRVETISNGAVGYIGGRLEYIGWVIGEGEQTSFFAGYWWTLQGVIRGARDGIVAVFRDGIKALVR